MYLLALFKLSDMIYLFILNAALVLEYGSAVLRLVNLQLGCHYQKHILWLQ